MGSFYDTKIFKYKNYHTIKTDQEYFSPMGKTCNLRTLDFGCLLFYSFIFLEKNLESLAFYQIMNY